MYLAFSVCVWKALTRRIFPFPLTDFVEDTHIFHSNTLFKSFLCSQQPSSCTFKWCRLALATQDFPAFIFGHMVYDEHQYSLYVTYLWCLVCEKTNKKRMSKHRFNQPTFQILIHYFCKFSSFICQAWNYFLFYMCATHECMPPFIFSFLKVTLQTRQNFYEVV